MHVDWACDFGFRGVQLWQERFEVAHLFDIVLDPGTAAGVVEQERSDQRIENLADDSLAPTVRLFRYRVPPSVGWNS